MKRRFERLRGLFSEEGRARRRATSVRQGVLVGAVAGLGGALGTAAALAALGVPLDRTMVGWGCLFGVGAMASCGALAPRSAFVAGLLGGAWLVGEVFVALIVLMAELLVAALTSFSI